MPVLEINEDEKKLLLIALVHDRVRLMHEWAKIGDDDGRIDPDGDRWVIDGVVDAMTDLRRKIEAADGADNTWPIDPILVPLSSRFDPKVSDQIDIAVNGSPKLKYVIRKSISTSLLEDIRQAAYASIDRLDAEHDEQVTEPKPAWHYKHGCLHPKKAMESAEAAVEAGDLTREEVADALGVDLAEVDAQIASIRDRLDRLEPGTWTTLPDEVDAEGWMFDVTDPESTTAEIDTQSTHDCKVSISITVGGKTLTIDDREDVLNTIMKLSRAADAA